MKEEYKKKIKNYQNNILGKVLGFEKMATMIIDELPEKINKYKHKGNLYTLDLMFGEFKVQILDILRDQLKNFEGYFCSESTIKLQKFEELIEEFEIMTTQINENMQNFYPTPNMTKQEKTDSNQIPTKLIFQLNPFSPPFDLQSIQNTSELKIKTIENIGENIKIDHQRPLQYKVQCTIVSRNIIYYVEWGKRKNLYKFDISRNSIQNYPCDDLEECRRISYNKYENKVYIIVRNKGVFWFVPGKEDDIQKLGCLSGEMMNSYSYNIFFYKKNAIFTSDDTLYYCKDPTTSNEALKLKIPPSDVQLAEFLSDQYVAVFNDKREFMVIDLNKNELMIRDIIGEKGTGKCMSIDPDRKMVTVCISENGFLKKSSWAKIYTFDVLWEELRILKVSQTKEVYTIKGGCCSIFDMKMVKMHEYDNALVLVTSGQMYKNGNNQVRMFNVGDEIREIEGIPDMNVKRHMLNIENLGGQFVFSSFDGYFTRMSVI